MLHGTPPLTGMVSSGIVLPGPNSVTVPFGAVYGVGEGDGDGDPDGDGDGDPDGDVDGAGVAEWGARFMADVETLCEMKTLPEHVTIKPVEIVMFWIVSMSL